MDIVYSTARLEALCSQERMAISELGPNGARKLKTRIADLQDAVNVSDLVAGDPHPLKGDRKGQFAVRLAGGCRLVFEPATQPPPLRDDGGIAWEQVCAVRIVFIGDYHD